MIGLTACSSKTSATNSTASTSENEKSVYSDDFVDIYYVSMFESYEDTAAVKFKVVNKTDKHIIVFPDNSYANDTSVVLTTGTFTEMDAGKNAYNTFVFFYKKFGIEKFDDIQSVTTQLKIQDENMADIEETSTITFVK